MQIHLLNAAVAIAGKGRGAIPPPLFQLLMDSIKIVRSLKRTPIPYRERERSLIGYRACCRDKRRRGIPSVASGVDGLLHLPLHGHLC